jgi:hypothetical protein
MVLFPGPRQKSPEKPYFSHVADYARAQSHPRAVRSPSNIAASGRHELSVAFIRPMLGVINQLRVTYVAICECQVIRGINLNY